MMLTLLRLVFEHQGPIEDPIRPQTSAHKHINSFVNYMGRTNPLRFDLEFISPQVFYIPGS